MQNVYVYEIIDKLFALSTHNIYLNPNLMDTSKLELLKIAHSANMMSADCQYYDDYVAKIKTSVMLS